MAAARRQFAESGFDRTSLRSVARQAGVDSSLVAHFYGSKQKLFVAVVELPFNPAEVLPGLLAGDRREAGLRLARFVLGILESPDGRERMTGLVRSAASEPEAARLVRERVTRELLGPLAESLGADDAALRASLVSSQIVGLVMARYVIGIEPLTSTDPATVAKTIGPVLQRYLTGAF